jgi:DNA-binding PadR family transcriptional regulator
MPTDLEMVILALLLSGQEMYAYEMVGADPRINENSVYVTLIRMVARRYLSCRDESEADRKKKNFKGGPKRKLYRIEAFGSQMYDVRLAADKAAERAMARGGLAKPQGAL